MVVLVQPPDIEDLEVIHPLGAGECGQVFLAKERRGREVVLKTFHPAAINAQVLSEANRRLEAGGWPAGVMPEWGANYVAQTPFRISPGCFDEAGEQRKPASLQHRLASFPGDQSWPVVRGMLKALAALHGCQVSHGNLKPGNVFFGPGGEVLLTDWAMGNMPGAKPLQFTDALLYQAPEQLREPGGYLREQGYRWDVFSFGVLAYRLLTGTFPRCGPTFDQVAPAPGLTRREGIAADLSLIAASIEAQPQVSWPDAAANPLETVYREILVRCLALDPMARPANAGEVEALFIAAEDAVKNERRTAAALDQGRRAQRLSWRATVASWILTAGVVVLCFLWQFNRSQISTSTERGEVKVRDLEDDLRYAREKQELSEKAAEGWRQELSSGTDLWLARIEASRSIGDHLFAWGMEKGNRRLPPLDGRELRLNRLDRYFLDFVTRTADLPNLKEERAMARLQLAEIGLAKGDAKLAERRLEEAVEGSVDLPGGPELDLRVATDRMLLALLLQEAADPLAKDAFAKARTALEHVPQADVDATRVQELLAVLDFHESRLLAANGQDAEALEKLHRSTEVLNRLTIERPDAMVLRSEMANCYLSSATILDGMGQMGDARNVRSMAADVLLKLITQSPGDLDLRLELAGCYGGMAEAAILAGDVAGTEAMSKAAVKLLEEILRQRPDDPEVRSRLAAQRSIAAGILRDRGDLVGATKVVDDGILLVEGLAIGKSADPIGKYRLALLWWQKGKIIGNEGHRQQEIEWEQKALAELKALSDTDYGLLRSEKVKYSIGYVLGDLGHAAQLASKPDLAKASFAEAVEIWELLKRDRPGNEEYDECLAWSRQRLNEVR